MSDWVKTPVASLIDAGKLEIGDGYRAKNEELRRVGVPFARAANVNNGFHFTDSDCLPEEDLGKVGNKVSRPGDVVFTSKGTVGRFGFVGPDLPRFVYSPQLCFWRSLDPDAVDPKFLYFWMCGREFRVQYRGVAGQTDMAEYVSLRDQRAMYLTTPPIEIQRAIARVLGTLDDKIELNRRMNETLEAMTRALFKSWFVDFDPVRAKMEGRWCRGKSLPGLPAEMWDLFPERLVESELGEIPEGWDATRWGKLVTLEYGKSLRGYQDRAGDFPVYGTNGPIGWHTEPLCPYPGIVVGRKGAYRGIHFSQQPFFVIDTAYYVRPVSDLNLRWAYYELRRNDLNDMDSGSAIPSTSRDEFYTLPVVDPGTTLQNWFASTLDPAWKRQRESDQETLVLSQIRDALLPKLVSGEIRVRDAERAVGRTTVLSPGVLKT